MTDARTREHISPKSSARRSCTATPLAQDLDYDPARIVRAKSSTPRAKDAMGRVRTPKAQRGQWQEVRRAGGVNYQTFASWVEQWRKQRGEYPSVAKGASSNEPRFSRMRTRTIRWTQV